MQDKPLKTKITLAYYKTLTAIMQGWLNLVTWFKANRAKIAEIISDIFELLLLIAVIACVFTGNLVHAVYYMGALILCILGDIRKYSKKAMSRKAEIDFSMDSDFLKSMVHGYVNRCGYDLVKKPETEEVDEFERTHGHKKGFRPTKK